MLIRSLADQYIDFFATQNIDFVIELPDAKANYWLNVVVLNDKAQRDLFLERGPDNYP